MVPSSRMCIVLVRSETQMDGVGEFKSGRYSRKFSEITLDTESWLYRILQEKEHQWHEIPDGLSYQSQLENWLLSGQEKTLYTVPFALAQAGYGVMLFRTKDFSNAEKLNLKPLSTIYAKHIELVYSMLTAVEARKKVENRLANLAFIVESSKEAILSLSNQGIITSWNKSAVELFGYDEEEILGKHESILIPDEEMDGAKDILEKLMVGKPVDPFETSRKRKDGTLIDVQITVSPIRGRNGELIGTSAILRDLTRQKEIDRKTKFVNSLLLAQQQASIDGILVVDGNGKMVSFNSRFVEMWNIPPEIIRSKSREQAFQHVLNNLADPKAFEKRVRYIYDHSDLTCHEEIEFADGSIFDRYTAPVRGEHKEYLGRIWYFRDITQAKVREQDLKKARIDAEAASHAKSAFLANMSHEIRTPLNAIVGFSQILLKQSDNGALPEEMIQYLDHIKNSGEFLSELINNILDLSKIEAGKMTISEEQVNFKQLVQGIYHIHMPDAEEKGLLFTYDYYDDVPETIVSDRTKLNQILMNLVANAIKFTTEGNVSLKIMCDKEEVVVQVTDDGIGIDENRLDAIFDTFEQADSSTTRRFGGTGLGLAITRKIVEILGGHIKIVSEIDHGSTVTVRLPLKEGDEEREDIPVEITNYKFSPDLLVLVVEDNEMNQVMAKGLLQKLGLTVQIAKNGQEGVNKTMQLDPDLILMDLHMPVLDGIEAMKKIRQHPSAKSIPIIALSADAFTQQQEMALKAGFTDYLTKPLKLDRLVPLLIDHLEKGPKTTS